MSCCRAGSRCRPDSIRRDAAATVSRFVAENFERYLERPVTREELEPMQIVARWLRERGDEGRVIELCSQNPAARLSPAALASELCELSEIG